MFSATVITRTSMKCWWTMPIPRAIAADGEPISTGWPSTRISPSSGLYRPYRTDISVDLPAPFSPSSAWTSPGITSKSTRSLATTEPNFFVIPLSSSAGGVDGVTAGYDRRSGLLVLDDRRGLDLAGLHLGDD